jgi:Nodulation protein Z (NodZ)
LYGVGVNIYEQNKKCTRHIHIYAFQALRIYHSFAKKLIGSAGMVRTRNACQWVLFSLFGCTLCRVCVTIFQTNHQVGFVDIVSSIFRHSTAVEKGSSNPHDAVMLELAPYDASNNILQHAAKFGLGHRFMKLSSAFHLAQRLGMAEVEPFWNADCPEPNMFGLLFGKRKLTILASRLRQPQCNKTVITSNDGLFYFEAVNYMDAGTAIPKSYFQANETISPFWDKIKSDQVMYGQMEGNFVHRDMVDNFTKFYKFEEHTVIGVHLRLGNGEGTHFKSSGRGVNDEFSFVESLAWLISERAKKNVDKPPLIFLATDTGSIIDAFQNAATIPVVIMPQHRPAPKEGVAYENSNKEQSKCFTDWSSMLLDMMLLARSNILVAAPGGSTFSQSLPLSLVFQRGGSFCDVSRLAPYTMTCYDSMETWVFGMNDEAGVTSFGLSSNHTPSESQTTLRLREISIHFPDPEPGKQFAEIESWIKNCGGEDTPPQVQRLGKPMGFNPKYRNHPPRTDNETGWRVNEDQ